MAAYIKYVRPEIRLLLSNLRMLRLAAAMHAKSRVVLPQVGLFADGVAVKQIGKNTFEILKDACDEVITVTTDEIVPRLKMCLMM